jgi:hypothetical protein
MPRSWVLAAAPLFLAACTSGGAGKAGPSEAAAAPPSAAVCKASPAKPVCCQAGALATPSTARCVQDADACRFIGGLVVDEPVGACA